MAIDNFLGGGVEPIVIGLHAAAVSEAPVQRVVEQEVFRIFVVLDDLVVNLQSKRSYASNSR